MVEMIVMIHAIVKSWADEIHFVSNPHGDLVVRIDFKSEIKTLEYINMLKGNIYGRKMFRTSDGINLDRWLSIGT